ncbi:hypothetical protein JCM11491_000685 [Sporobolomyces phaffii]
MDPATTPSQQTHQIPLTGREDPVETSQPPPQNTLTPPPTVPNSSNPFRCASSSPHSSFATPAPTAGQHLHPHAQTPSPDLTSNARHPDVPHPHVNRPPPPATSTLQTAYCASAESAHPIAGVKYFSKDDASEVLEDWTTRHGKSPLEDIKRYMRERIGKEKGGDKDSIVGVNKDNFIRWRKELDFCVAKYPDAMAETILGRRDKPKTEDMRDNKIKHAWRLVEMEARMLYSSIAGSKAFELIADLEPLHFLARIQSTYARAPTTSERTVLFSKIWTKKCASIENLEELFTEFQSEVREYNEAIRRARSKIGHPQYRYATVPALLDDVLLDIFVQSRPTELALTRV